MIRDDKTPSRKETLEKLESLVKGTLTPPEVDDWACPWIVNGPYESVDSAVWIALMKLCGADLKTDVNTYLHCQEDFTSWLAEFKKNCSLNPEKK